MANPLKSVLVRSKFSSNRIKEILYGIAFFGQPNHRDFRPSRAGEHARSFLSDWQGKLVCDDFTGCMAHARRKFFDLHAANQSQLAEQALQYIGQLYEVEREGARAARRRAPATAPDKARPIIDGLHSWMLGQRQKVPEGSAIAKALDYSLKRWAALVRYLNDGNLPIDNNWIENQIRPWTLVRSNWLFARLAVQWPAWRSLDDADPVSPPERARSVRLPEGRAHAPADAEGQRPDRAAAA